MSTTNQCWWGCEEEKNPYELLLGMQIIAATMENSMELPLKIKNGSALWSSNFTSGNISEEIWNANSKEYIHLYVHCHIIYNSQHLETAKCPSVDELIYSSVVHEWYKTAVVHLYNGILFTHKKRRESYPLQQHRWTWRSLGLVK